MLLLGALIVCFAIPACAQFTSLPGAEVSLHPVASHPDSVYLLLHMFLSEQTESVLLDGTIPLVRGREYAVFPRHGSIRFLPPFWDTVAVRKLGHTPLVVVRFQYFPFSFQDSYAKRNIVVMRDSTDTLRVVKPVSSFNVNDVFGENLQKSGSIFRGFTIGTNRDLSLSSGLRMQLSGKIAQDVDVAAVLTDDNTPIQPEGTTQTLQEFDKVFVEIKGRDLGATLGDFVLDLKGTEFAGLSRKLQGAKGTAEYRAGWSDGSVVAAAAITRGKFNSIQMNGQEGVQGPYILTGKTGEKNIIVVAGTERVYVNGEQMTRGESNDYTIDYSIGEITFMTRRLITAASRITIDFEYTDRQYSRSLLAAQTTSDFLDRRARLTLTFMREADDPDAPIDLVLSDSVRQAIAAAGSDPAKAYLPGVTRVDSNGLYARVDTVLANDSAVTFYRYAAGDTSAHYTITFSYVGSGKGSYIRKQIGVYVWMGAGNGSYEPIRRLPLPQKHDLMDVALALDPGGGVRLTGELSGSSVNPNRLSMQSVSQDGHGINVGIQYKPSAFAPWGVRLGNIELAARERYTSTEFQPLDRTTEIEFSRKWGIDSLTQVSEEIREAAVKYMPDSAVALNSSYGRNERGGGFRSTRNDGSVLVQSPLLPTASYTIESIRTHDDSTATASNWLRQKGSIARAFGNVTPTVHYESEKRTYTNDTADVATGSFAFRDAGAGIAISGFGPLTFAADYSVRHDDLASAKQLVYESKSLTQTYSAKVSEWQTITDQLDVTVRNRYYSDVFHELGNADTRSVLVRNQTRVAPLRRGIEADATYEVSTERTARLERVFVRVATGTGTYKYLGDVNGNGLADDDEFVLARFDGDYITETVSSDDLVPVIDLHTGFRVRVTPSRFVDASTWLGKAASAVSTESYLKIEEKSSERDLKQIYLLHLSHFLRDSTTLVGLQQFTQDVLVLEGNPLFSARLRFNDRRGLGNYSSGMERTYLRERSLRLRWQLIPEVSNQIDLTNKDDALADPLLPSKERNIAGNDVTLDFSYRPEQDLEIGMKFEVARSHDYLTDETIQADLNVQSVRAVYAFRGAGQARAEFGREEMQLSNVPSSFPYELTGGRVAGITWIWRGALDYRITQFLQATVNYEGRIEAAGTPVHTARAEMRAFF